MCTPIHVLQNQGVAGLSCVPSHREAGSCVWTTQTRLHDGESSTPREGFRVQSPDITPWPSREPAAGEHRQSATRGPTWPLRHRQNRARLQVPRRHPSYPVLLQDHSGPSALPAAPTVSCPQAHRLAQPQSPPCPGNGSLKNHTLGGVSSLSR